MQIRFNLNKALLETMAEEEYEAIEMAQDGQARLYRLRPLMARFMVDEQGQPLDHEAAKKLLGKVPMGAWADVTNQFANAFRETAVPNVIGRPSSLASEASLTPPSLTGAEL